MPAVDFQHGISSSLEVQLSSGPYRVVGYAVSVAVVSGFLKQTLNYIVTTH